MMRRPLSAIEYSHHSQNGEDGIIDYLLRCCTPVSAESRDGLPEPMFVEIGCGSGKKNNTTNLVLQGWGGIAIDRRRSCIDSYRRRRWFRTAAYCIEVTAENAHELFDILPPAPGLFSLDIDSIDWHVAAALLGRGFRPDVMVLEYNATFGLEPLTVPARQKQTDKRGYFGAGVMAWRHLLEPLGYRFVTVETSGTNCFFVRTEAVRRPGELEAVEWLPWSESRFLAQSGSPEERLQAFGNLYLMRV